MNIDPLLSLALHLHSSKGVYALLLGSGVSRAAKIPTGWDVVLDLIRRIAKLQNADPEPDPAAWFKTTYNEEPDYSKLLDQLASTPEQRQQILRGYFEPTEEERRDGLKQPTAAHKAIARLVAGGYVRVILTTNFDRLMERAIEEAGITPVVLSTPDSLAGALPLAHQRCIIIKLHGDYLDTRILNTPAELAKYTRATDKWLNRVFDEFGLIIAGWSGEWDTALRAAIERCNTRRFGCYWASVGDPRPTATALVNQRGGSVVRITDADRFFTDLADKVAALEDVYPEHPLNVAAAVAMVKRYLADPNGQIRLHDLFMRETDRAFAEIDRIHDTVRNANRTPSTTVSGYLAATATLRHMAAVAGYWGGDAVVPLLLRCIAKLDQDKVVATGRGGVILNDAFRLFPVMAIVYSAGLGFIAADRFVPAARLLTKAQTHGYNGARPLLVGFTHSIGDIHSIAKSVPEYTQKRVPFAELMFDTFGRELPDLFTGPQDFDRRYDEYELLAAMLYGDMGYDSLPAKPEDLNLTPGRYVWKHYHLQTTSGLFWKQDQGDELVWSRSQPAFVELVENKFFHGEWKRVTALRRAAAGTSMRWRLGGYRESEK